MEWEMIKMTAGVQITNLLDNVSKEMIYEFLSKSTNRIESIAINGTSADVILTNEDDLDSVLKLSGQEMNERVVYIQKQIVSDELSDPEILDEDTPKVIPDVQVDKKATRGIRIKNLSGKIRKDNIIDFLSRVTDEIESIVINDSYADVILSNEEDLESVLMLNGQEILGSRVKLLQLIVTEDLPDHEILVKDYTRSMSETEKNRPQEKNQKELKIDKKSNIKIDNSLQLKEILQGLSLEHRNSLPQNDYFYVVMDTKFVAFVSMISLIVLTFSDIFGY